MQVDDDEGMGGDASKAAGSAGWRVPSRDEHLQESEAAFPDFSFSIIFNNLRGVYYAFSTFFTLFL